MKLPFFGNICTSVKMVRGFSKKLIFHRGGRCVLFALHSDVLCEIQDMLLSPTVLKLAA